MAGDQERLIVLLEARLTDFEKNMRKASGTAGSEFGKVRKYSKSATSQMEADMARSTARMNQQLAGFSSKMGSYGKAFATGLIGGFVGAGLVGITSQLGDMAKSIAQVGDEAKRAGMSAQAFQEWKFVAEQNRIGVDALVDGFKELSLRADEFILTGKGSGAEAFQRLGYGADELRTKLKNPSELMLEIIGRLGQLNRAAQIRIGDELFGGSAGERFVELLDQGEAGIRKTIGRAHELGVVMDDELIKRAADLDRQFNEVANTVGTTLKSAIVSAAASLQSFLDRFKEIDARQEATVLKQIAESERNLKAAQSRLGGLGGLMDGALKKQIEKSQSEINDLRASLRDRKEPASPKGARPGSTWTPPDKPEYIVKPLSTGRSKKKAGKSQMEKDAESYRRVVQAAQQRIDQMKVEAIAATKTGEEATKLRMATDLLADAQKNGKKITEDQALELEKLAEAYAKAATEAQAARIQQDLLFERQQMFRSPTEQRVHETLRSAGIDYSSTQGQMIANQIRLNEQLALSADLTKEFASGLINDLMSGKSATEALTNAFSRLADRLLQMALDNAINALFGNLMGSFGGGGFFGGGGAFPAAPMGLFAQGGISNKPAIFGEAGPEAAVPLPDGRRIPVDLRGAGGGASSVHVTVGFRSDDLNLKPQVVSIAQNEASSASRQAIHAYDHNLPDRMRQVQNDPRAR